MFQIILLEALGRSLFLAEWGCPPFLPTSLIHNLLYNSNSFEVHVLRRKLSRPLQSSSGPGWLCLLLRFRRCLCFLLRIVYQIGEMETEWLPAGQA